ncbi:MAG: MoaD/ThiS family protein [Proteobacteria bacterium]|nr:MoaD/ThiS family protein [Pseudomonadota bacterium]
MCLKLRLSPSLNDEVGGQLELELTGLTVGECLEKTKHHYPDVADKIWKHGSLNPQILLFHNNTLLKEHNFSTLVEKRDVLDIIPAIEGG